MTSFWNSQRATRWNNASNVNSSSKKAMDAITWSADADSTFATNVGANSVHANATRRRLKFNQDLKIYFENTYQITSLTNQNIYHTLSVFKYKIYVIEFELTYRKCELKNKFYLGVGWSWNLLININCKKINPECQLTITIGQMTMPLLFRKKKLRTDHRLSVQNMCK